MTKYQMPPTPAHDRVFTRDALGNVRVWGKAYEVTDQAGGAKVQIFRHDDSGFEHTWPELLLEYEVFDTHPDLDGLPPFPWEARDTWICDGNGKDVVVPDGCVDHDSKVFEFIVKAANAYAESAWRRAEEEQD